MNNERDPRFVDDLLEAALRNYNPAPRSGLEHRVLAGIRARREKRAAWWRWQWAIAAVAAVVLIAAGVYFARVSAPPRVVAMSQPAPGTLPPTDSARNNSVARPGSNNAVAAPTARFAPPHAARSRVATTMVAVAASRPTMFPSPAPISPQERLLAHAVQHADVEALRALASAAASAEPLAPPATPVLETPPVVEVAPAAPAGTEPPRRR